MCAKRLYHKLGHLCIDLVMSITLWWVFIWFLSGRLMAVWHSKMCVLMKMSRYVMIWQQWKRKLDYLITDLMHNLSWLWEIKLLSCLNFKCEINEIILQLLILSSLHAWLKVKHHVYCLLKYGYIGRNPILFCKKCQTILYRNKYSNYKHGVHII